LALSGCVAFAGFHALCFGRSAFGTYWFEDVSGAVHGITIADLVNIARIRSSRTTDNASGLHLRHALPLSVAHIASIAQFARIVLAALGAGILVTTEHASSVGARAWIGAVVFGDTARIAVSDVVRKAEAHSITRIGGRAFALREVATSGTGCLRRIILTSLRGTVAFRFSKTVARWCAACGVQRLHLVHAIAIAIAEV
jgi:hypothetical protein